MFTALLGIQTIAIVTASSYVIKHFRPKFKKMIVQSNSNGYKHYKTF